MLLGWQVPTTRLAGCGGGCGCAPCRGGLGDLGDLAADNGYVRNVRNHVRLARESADRGDFDRADQSIESAVAARNKIDDPRAWEAAYQLIVSVNSYVQNKKSAVRVAGERLHRDQRDQAGVDFLSSVASSVSDGFSSLLPSEEGQTRTRTQVPEGTLSTTARWDTPAPSDVKPPSSPRTTPKVDPKPGLPKDESTTLADTVAQAGAAGDAKTADAAGSFLGMSESFGGGLNLPMGILGVGAGAASGISILEINKGKGSDKPLTSKQIQKKRTTSLITGSATGAVSGAAFGTMVFPGIGTAIGAVVGGAGGAAGALIANKDLAKKNRKLKQRLIATNLTAIQAQRAEEAAAADEARQTKAQLDRAKLRVSQLEREADRWLIAVRQQRGDLDSAEALRQEVASLRIEAASARDLDTAQLIAQQAAEAVDNLKVLAGQRVAGGGLQGLGSCYDGACGVWNRPRRGLGGLGSANDHVFAVRRANRAALGLTPQEDTPSSGGLGAGVILAAVVFGTMLGPDLFAAFGGSGGSKKRR